MSRRRTDREPSKLGAYIIVGIIAVLMVTSLGSMLLYAPPPAGDIIYAEHVFGIENEMYVTGGYQFNNLPFSALSVPTDPAALDLLRFAQQPVMVFDPTDVDLATIDFVRLELATIMPSLGSGMTQESDVYSLPIFDCQNASAPQPVLFVRTAQRPSIFVDGYCVILQGNASTLVLAKDAFIYNYQNIFTAQDIEGISFPTLALEEFHNGTQVELAEANSEAGAGVGSGADAGADEDVNEDLNGRAVQETNAQPATSADQAAN